MKRLLFYLASSFLVFISVKVQAQCGTETFTVGDWCENQYATWTITNPEAGAKYHWYEPVLNAAGTAIIDTLDRFYGENANGTSFASPYRYTTPSPVPTTLGWDERKFWYQKEKPVTGFIPSAGNVTGPTNTMVTPYSMNVTALTTIRYNTLSVPVVLYNAASTYSIQIQIGTNYSAVYNFSGSSATNISGQLYLVKIPVNLTIPAGSYAITAVANPVGSIKNVDGFNWRTDAASKTAFSVAGVVSAISPATSVYGNPNNYSIIYDWDITSYCDYKYTPVAKKQL